MRVVGIFLFMGCAWLSAFGCSSKPRDLGAAAAGAAEAGNDDGAGASGAPIGAGGHSGAAAAGEAGISSMSEAGSAGAAGAGEDLPCGGADLDSDPKNCGTCDNDCTSSPNLAIDAPGITCKAGKCVIPDSACIEGKKHCSVEASDVCETDVTTSTECGACGVKCDQIQVCAAGKCSDSCPAGETKCTSGQSVGCYALASSTDNCGACGKACPQPASNGTASCQTSACKVLCSSGYHQCNSSPQCEANDDAAHCGPTCKQCESNDPNATAKCTNNLCSAPCNTGYQYCGFCIPKNDPNNCGACGNVCGNAKTCSNGTCLDTVAPTIVTITPSNGTTNLTLAKSIIVITFSEPMNQALAQAAYSSGAGGGTPSFTWSAGGTVLTVDPKLSYAASSNPSAAPTPFTFTIAATAKDLAGNALTSAVNVQFSLLRRITQVLPLASGGNLGAGEAFNSSMYSSTFVGAGDYTANIAYRGFMTFDISSMPAQVDTIESATLQGSIVQVDSTPFEVFGNLLIQSIAFSPPATNVAYSAAPRLDLGTLIAAGKPGDAVVKDVLNAVKADYAERAALSNRSQYRIQFGSGPYVDSKAQQVWLLTGNGSLKLTVQYLAP